MQWGESTGARAAASHKVLSWVWRDTRAGPRVLLLKRAPPWPREWHPVTGHVDAGESLAEAAAREAREETGFDAADVQDLEFNYAYADGGRSFVEHAFALRVDSDRCELSHEHEEFEWAAIPEAGERLRFPEQREALRRLAVALDVPTPWSKDGAA